VAAIEALGATLALYRSDLLDSPDMPNYRWMYDEDPQVALTFRSDYRRRHKDTRIRLAKLLASGPQLGLAWQKSCTQVCRRGSRMNVCGPRRSGFASARERLGIGVGSASPARSPG
jgi:hypothetical protein